ncbi:MAG: Unknown protein [uncultured Sulfurovum sp.]|uniref:Uncharacterized protein n=1 Tax=uncultured Sulfurovum sp. TaxID=269237 RepID=A0A6S6TW16_9BACT|nr:MAG: Unknown protein [uncultured Sulfurovum sp.]
MSTKTKLLLDTNYYSADVYQKENKSLKPIVKKLFIMVIIFTLMTAAYSYFIKNNLNKIHPLWVKVKSIVLLEEEKTVLVKRELVQVKTEAKVMTNNELSENYVKRVQESLGNY